MLRLWEKSTNVLIHPRMCAYLIFYSKNVHTFLILPDKILSVLSVQLALKISVMIGRNFSFMKDSFIGMC